MGLHFFKKKHFQELSLDKEKGGGIAFTSKIISLKRLLEPFGQLKRSINVSKHLPFKQLEALRHSQQSVALGSVGDLKTLRITECGRQCVG